MKSLQSLIIILIFGLSQLSSSWAGASVEMLDEGSHCPMMSAMQDHSATDSMPTMDCCQQQDSAVQSHDCNDCQQLCQTSISLISFSQYNESIQVFSQELPDYITPNYLSLVLSDSEPPII